MWCHCSRIVSCTFYSCFCYISHNMPGWGGAPPLVCLTFTTWKRLILICRQLVFIIKQAILNRKNLKSSLCCLQKTLTYLEFNWNVLFILKHLTKEKANFIMTVFFPRPLDLIHFWSHHLFLNINFFLHRQPTQPVCRSLQSSLLHSSAG